MSASAAPYNITIDRGSDWSKVLTLSDNSGDPVAITNIFTVAISITGTTSPSVAAASLTYVSADLWTSNGNATAPGSGTWIRVRRSGGAWEITHWVAGVQSTGYWTSSSNPNHPAWVETWVAAAGATGSPVVDSAGMFFEGSVSLQERGPDVIPFSFDTVGDGSAGQVEISLSRSYTRALANSGAYRFDWFVYRGRERIRLVAGRITAQGSSTGTSTGIPIPAFGSSPSIAWGNITGTLSDQTDLQAALDAISGGGGASAWDDLTGTASDVPFLPVAAPAHSEGLLFYDSTDKSLTYYNDEADVSMNIGREMWVRVRNNSGAQISNGKVVYINDALGQLPTIRLARADSATTSRVIGIATHDIGNNEFGYVTTTGEVKGLATNAYDDGDLLFLSAVTAGDLTLTAPLAPNRVIQVATVLHAHPTQGKLYCHPETDSIPSTGIVDSTATGRALITAANAAAARTTLELAAAATASTPNTLVLRDANGDASFGALDTSGLTVTGGTAFGDASLIQFDAVEYYYGAGAASAHRTALGSQATGDALFTAATPSAARTTLGVRTFTKSANQSKFNDTTYADDSELKDIPLEIGKSYKIEFYIAAYLPLTEGGKARLLVPYGNVSAIQAGFVTTAQWGNSNTGSINITNAATRIFSLADYAGYNQTRALSGVAYTGTLTQSGVLSLQWAQRTSGANAMIMQAGSLITVTEL